MLHETYTQACLQHPAFAGQGMMAVVRIALMRPEDRAGKAVEYCRMKGLDPLVAPAIGIRDLEVEESEVLRWLNRCDICIFMSSTAVDRFFSLGSDCSDALRRKGINVVAVGKATSVSLDAHSIANSVPATYSSQGLVEYVKSLEGANGPAVVFRSDSGTGLLKNGLAATGLEVKEFAVYGIAMPEDTGPIRAVIADILGGQGYILPFSSSMMVRNFFRLVSSLDEKGAMPSAIVNCSIWAIGAETAAELKGQTSAPVSIASSADFESMLGEIADSIQGMDRREKHHRKGKNF